MASICIGFYIQREGGRDKINPECVGDDEAPPALVDDPREAVAGGREPPQLAGLVIT
jgi:hypothetical protein